MRGLARWICGVGDDEETVQTEDTGDHDTGGMLVVGWKVKRD